MRLWAFVEWSTKLACPQNLLSLIERKEKWKTVSKIKTTPASMDLSLLSHSDSGDFIQESQNIVIYNTFTFSSVDA